MEEFSEDLVKHRTVIESAEEVSPIEIHRRTQAVYGEQCVNVSTVRRWVRRFRDGEMRQAYFIDKTRSGKPVTVSDQLHQDRFEELTRGNRRLKQKEIAVALRTSVE